VSPSEQKKVCKTETAINYQFEVIFSCDDQKQDRAHGHIASHYNIPGRLLQSCNLGYVARAVDYHV